MKLANVPVALAVLSALVLIVSGFGARFGIWDYRLGINLMRWSFYAGLAIAALALIALVIPRVRAGRAWSLAAAIIIVLGSLATCISRTLRIARLLDTPP